MSQGSAYTRHRKAPGPLPRGLLIRADRMRSNYDFAGRQYAEAPTTRQVPCEVPRQRHWLSGRYPSFPPNSGESDDTPVLPRCTRVSAGVPEPFFLCLPLPTN